MTRSQNLTLLVLLTSLFINWHTHASNGRYRLTLRDNPATTAVIGWDQLSGSNPILYYGTTDYGTDWSSYPNQAGPDRVVDYLGMDNHFVRLTGLQPNTNYYFVIKDSEGLSDRFWFKTAPDSSTERLSFISGGDSRNNRTPRQNANQLVKKLRPHAVLFGGDMTNYGTTSEWKEWFDDWQLTIGDDGRIIPIVAARGNHESSNDVIYNLFDVPSSNVYYALTFGGNLIRAYTLNTETSISGSQTDWLSNDLNNHNNVVWKMAQYHKPMRPHTSGKSEGNTQYNNWAYLFYQQGVKVVVECDAHTVKSTWPIRPSSGSGNDEGFIRDDENGSVYVGEGCWGAPLRSNDDNKNWTRDSGRFNQFKWIFVDENKIELRTIKVDNASQVGTVNDNDVFTPPSNLDIWSPSNGSVITIEKNSTPPDDGSSKVLEVRINNGNDDVEEAEDGEIYFNSSDLELVYDSYKSAGDQTVGLRFNGINIPKNATITDAYIQFTVDETGSTIPSLTIQGEDSDDSAPFEDIDYNVSNRSLTSSSVSWTPGAWTSKDDAGPDQRTPNISSIIQEIINRTGWIEGNSVSLIITGSGKRTARSYNNSSSKAPLLYIEYSTENSETPSLSASRLVDHKMEDSGIKDQKNTENGEAIKTIQLVPNPATTDLRITSQNEILSIRLYDPNQKCIHFFELSKGSRTHKLDLQDLNPGLYTVQIKTIKGIEVQRLIIKH
ncbi:fibronectin type III domain-containing protein [Xanthovirga aplysinae]|uniref:fibronectin type III domain-containing protein n=1 Tax=Xanthovirga aplysinae TaxID=2529853 RepID=UPI0012BC21FC|nr:fibronectin type III domain-containing protein [Xanthovirga aplysinae]MTI31543.1 T9SS type A sorting domain-containing protein [Xanthovirga aplysinae]